MKADQPAMTQEMFDDLSIAQVFAFGFRRMSQLVMANAEAKGFWYDGEMRNKAEMIALMHSELSEALESIRKDFNRPDEHCPDYTSVEVELADCIIRIMDFAYGFGLRVEGAVIAKVAYNETRPFKHGKKF